MYDSTNDTLNHINRVRALLKQVRKMLRLRGKVHDRSKLQDPEKRLFDQHTPRLRELTYGSDEYRQALEDLGPALHHHYRNNSHHPEHFYNGVSGMNLLDVIEMLADWKAASERTDHGSLARSLEINRERFQIDDQLYNILVNTARTMGWA